MFVGDINNKKHLFSIPQLQKTNSFCFLFTLVRKFYADAGRTKKYHSSTLNEKAIIEVMSILLSFIHSTQ